MSEQIIRGALVLQHAAHTPEALDLYIQNGKIKEVVPAGTPLPQNAPVFDATGYLIHAGLINAHTHGHGALAKGTADKWNLEQLIVMGSLLNHDRTLHHHTLSAQLNAAEMLLKGCTAAFDLYTLLPAPSTAGLQAIAQAYSDSGLRVVLAPMFADLSIYQALPDLHARLPAGQQSLSPQHKPVDYQHILENIKPALRHEFPRIRWALSPSIPLVSSDEFLLACHTIASDLGLSIHTHALESPLQKHIYRSRYEGGLIAHMAQLDLLDPALVLAHCVWLTDDERRVLADNGVRIAHNPLSNLRLGSGIADVRAMLAHGLTVGIGTDGASSGDNQNMYEAMRTAALLSRVTTNNVDDWLGARDVFYAATEGSAACLGYEGRLGRVDTGYLADLVFIDLDHINWQPLNNVLHQLVYVEDAHAVRHVMVDGKWAVRDRALTQLSLKTLQRNAHQAHDELQLMSGLNSAQSQVLLKTVSQFCACHT